MDRLCLGHAANHLKQCSGFMHGKMTAALMQRKMSAGSAQADETQRHDNRGSLRPLGKSRRVICRRFSQAHKEHVPLSATAAKTCTQSLGHIGKHCTIKEDCKRPKSSSQNSANMLDMASI